MIDRSTDEDLTQILDWLRLEAEEERNTFHTNRDMIVEGHGGRKLFVLREGVEVAAFALGGAGVIDIFETRPGYRGQAYGRELAQFCIERAATADMAVIEFECAPRTSLPFWQAMGFEQIRPRHGSNPWVSLRVARRHTLPAGDPVDVIIRTFDEAVTYSDIAPMHEYRPTAIRSPDGVIHLSERVVLHEPDLPDNREPAVEIVVAGNRVALDKAKRPELAAIGVRHDRFLQYYIDQIDPDGA